jgi:hypothetical protein
MDEKIARRILESIDKEHDRLLRALCPYHIYKKQILEKTMAPFGIDSKRDLALMEYLQRLEGIVDEESKKVDRDLKGLSWKRGLLNLLSLAPPALAVGLLAVGGYLLLTESPNPKHVNSAFYTGAITGALLELPLGIARRYFTQKYYYSRALKRIKKERESLHPDLLNKLSAA